MLLPVGDDNPNERTPVVHYGILGVNVAVFLYMLTLGDAEVRHFLFRWGLVPADFNVVSLFTSLYVHGGLAHLFGNMLFLWIVGDNVEDRMGHAGYFIFYHVAGAAASLTHVALHGASALPLVGASGAISAVMGAYAVFFPNSKIRIWYWAFFLFGVAYVSAKWAVGLWFAEQILFQVLSGGGRFSPVSYDAHIGGLLFGVAVAIVLRQFVLKKPDTVRRIVTPEPGAAGEGIFDAGLAPDNEIDGALDAGREDEAFRAFTRATGAPSQEPVGEATLARLGDALTLASAYGPAARVYEELLRAYPEGELSPEAAFRLGTIQSRVFEDFLRARDNLLFAHRRHSDPDRRARALDELKRIDAHLRDGLFRRGK